MSRWGLIVILFLPSLLAETVYSQVLTIKPYVGYATIRMSKVNQEMGDQVERLNRETQTVVPPPDPFEGNYAWGVQINYRMKDDYFMNLNTYYYRDKTGIDYRRTISGSPLDFHYSRQVELFEISFGLQYYFNYSSWKTLNTYLGGGAGLGLGWSESIFQYDYDQYPEDRVNNNGDFSSNALTAYFCAGANLKVSPLLYLNGEIGARFADLQQMEGQLRTLKGTDPQFTTAANYDFTGFYITLGTGLILPFLK